MKREFSIGEIAKIINVARSTVINWVKEERLEAFQLPGGNNRVTRENLIKFMRSYNIPLDFLEQSTLKRVLIVDDEQDVLETLSKAFKSQTEFDVRTASTGFQTGMITREYRPHVILLDIGLEDLDGRDVCNTLREDDELSETRIIAISGTVAAEEEEALLSQGFDMFMRKPIDMVAMLDSIKELLKLK